MRIKTSIVILTCLLAGTCALSAADHAGRDEMDFNDDWRFSRGFSRAMIQADFDDSDWPAIRLPHDWAIAGPFDPKQHGSTGKLPWRGEGTYRKRFHIPPEAAGKRFLLLFDGVMASPEVFVNGMKAGSWDYGYGPFSVDITEQIRVGRENMVAVHCDTRNFRSRWYPGAGIYRKVSLLELPPVHVPLWGAFVTTSELGDGVAELSISTGIANSGDTARSVELDLTVVDPAGEKVAATSESLEIRAGETVKVAKTLSVENPERWDIDNPVLYSLQTTIRDERGEVDGSDTPFGIRTMKFTADDGFHLNGRRVQLRGVNLHHGNGPIGAVALPRAIERKLQIMKDMGANAVRSSHNIPSSTLLDLCDRMGLLVFNEGFDKWEKTMGLQKPEDEFREVMERNAANWIRRDRNHPSVMLWSMCNENWRQLITPWGREGIEFCVDLYKRLDPTRPVTIGDFRPKELLKDHPGTLEPVDIASWNYNGCYAMSKEVYPEKPVIYSESASSVSTRGYYEIPHPEKMRQWSDTRQVESYDLSGKVDYPDREFYRMERDRYVAGEFVWTGFDYLGEPSPFDKEARSSYYGIVDLCGIPKDRFYLYRSYWNTEDVTVHILPHWNWPERCGKEVPVYVYTSGDEAELFLNGKSLERRKKQAAETGRELLPQGIDAGIVNRYRLRWEEVVYQPGELKAVAYKNGRKIGESVIRTAGEPAGIRLTADRREIAADGDDLCYVKVEMVDKDGNPCPLATNMLHYNVTGPVQLVAVGNGNPIGMDAFTDKQHPLFYGKAMAVLRSMKNSSGAATLDVSGEGVGESSLTIESIYQ